MGIDIYAQWKRQTEEAKTLAKLTGWNLAGIRRKMKLGEAPKGADWYQNIFK